MPDLAQSPATDAQRPLEISNPSPLTVPREETTIQLTSKNDGAPSNETLLGTAFVSFLSFSLLQLFFAFVAGSEAMMGDSAAMMVDALTYFLNWVAERRKQVLDRLQIDNVQQERNRQKQLLYLEILPPLVSVSTLVVVTIVVTKKAIQVIILDRHRDPSEQLIPNVNLMMTFSILNLALDGLNVFCFARAKHLLGYSTHEDQLSDDSEGSDEGHDARVSPVKLSRGSGTYSGLDTSDHELAIPPPPLHGVDDEEDEDDEEHPPQGHHAPSGHHNNANLNMCSAYTHVFADTLRSIAVIVAAVLAKLVEGITPEVADSVAAVVVSALILLSLIPLGQGLHNSLAELGHIRAQERTDQIQLDYNGDQQVV